MWGTRICDWRDEEAEAGRERDAGGVGVSEGDQDSGAGFGGKELRAVGVDGREQAAGDVEGCSEEDGVEGFGGLKLESAGG